MRVGGELRGELLVAEDALDGGLRVVEVASTAHTFTFAPACVLICSS